MNGYEWLNAAICNLAPRTTAPLGELVDAGGSLPFGVPRLVLSVLGIKVWSWSGKALEGLVPGAPALGVARPRADPLGFFHPSCSSHLHWSGASQGGGQ